MHPTFKQYQRLCAALNVDTQRALAEKLGITQPAIVAGLKRNNDGIPETWLVRASLRHGVDPALIVDSPEVQR